MPTYFQGITEGWLRDLVNNGQDSGQLVDPYGQNGWVRLGCEAIARSIYNTPGSVVDPKDPDKKRVLPPNDSRQWLTELLKRPMPRMSRSDLIGRTIALLHVDGAVFWAWEDQVGGRLIAEGEIPGYIVIIPASKMKPIYSKKFGRRSRVEAWEYREGERYQRIELHQVSRFAFPNPKDPYEPLSPLRAVWDDIKADFNAARFNNTFFEKGTHAGGILQVEGNLPPEERTRLKSFFMDKHAGAHRAGEPLVLSGGMTYIPAASQADMQYAEQRRQSRDAILSLLRVPHVMAGIFDNAPNATHLAQVGQYYQNTVLPLMSMIEGVLEEQFPESPYRFDRESIDALDFNLLNKVEQAERLIAVGIPQNEAHRIVGIATKPNPWGEIWWAPPGLVNALTGKPMADGSSEEDRREPRDESDSNGPQGRPLPQRPESEAIAAPEQSRLALPDHSSRGEFVDWEVVEKDAGESINSRVLQPGERLIESAFKAYFYRLAQEQIALVSESSERQFALLSLKTRSHAEEGLLFSRSEWDQKLAAEMIRYYEQVARISTLHAAEEIGVTPALRGPEVEALLREKVVRSTVINETLRKRAAKIIAEGLARGRSKAWIAQKLQEDFKLSEGSAKRIARTETGAIVNASRVILFEKEGVELKRWQPVGDHRVRGTHRLLGRVRALPMRANYAPFIGKQGATLRWPHDMRGPREEVINCRCVIVPALGG